MAKAKGKSSASAGTRKKQARKATEKDDGAGHPQQQQQSKKNKASKKHGKGQPKPPPPPKKFIPPPKPPRPAPDPLDALGLASILPADLVVILRKLSKRDGVTKGRAVEELQAWVADVEQREMGEEGVALAVPVWLHHLPSLLLSPTRRLRQTSSALHAALLSPALPSVRSTILYSLSSGEQPQALGAWLLAGNGGWDDAVSWTTASDGDRLNLSEPYLLDPLLIYISNGIRSPFTLLPAPFPQPTSQPPSGASTPKRPGPPAPTPSETRKERLAELEESAASRDARIRTAGLVALGWVLEHAPEEGVEIADGLADVLESGALWEAMGARDGEQMVRRAAWGVLGKLVGRSNGALIEPHLEPAARAVFANAFEEAEPTVRAGIWDGLLPFLRKYPQAWEIASTPEAKDEEEGEEDEDEDEDEDEEPSPSPSPAAPAAPLPQPISSLLTYLQLSCRSPSPQTSYPSLLLLLSTLPPALLPPPTRSALLLSLLAPLASGALPPPYQARAAEALLVAAVECGAFLGVREHRAGRAEEGRMVVREWVDAVWEAFVGREVGRDARRVGAERVGAVLGEHVARLEGTDGDLVTSALEPISTTSLALAAAPPTAEAGACLATALSALAHSLPQASVARGAAVKLVREAVGAAAAAEVEEGIEGRLALFENALKGCGKEVFADSSLAETLDTLALITLPHLLLSPVLSSRATTLLLSYLAHRASASHAVSAWRGTLAADPPTSVLRELLRAERAGELDSVGLERAGAEGEGVDERVLSVAGRVVGGKAEEGEEEVLQGVLQSAQTERFVSALTAESVTTLLTDTLATLVSARLRSAETDATPALASVLRLLRAAPRATVAPDAFVAAFLLPSSDVRSAGRALWEAVRDEEGVGAAARARVAELVGDVSVLASPKQILKTASVALPSTSAAAIDLVTSALPELGILLSTITSYDVPPSLGVLDPLVPEIREYDPPSRPADKYDQQGLSSYARSAGALLALLSSDRARARESPAALKHVLALGQLAADERAVRGSTIAFGPGVEDRTLREIEDTARGVVANALSHLAEDVPPEWHAAAVGALRKGTESARSSAPDALVGLLAGVWGSGEEGPEPVFEARLLRTLLEGVFKYGGPGMQEGERWLALAQDLFQTAPHTAKALLYATKDLVVGSPRLARMLNELASRLSGVHSSRASTEGLALLRLLLAAAPPLDSAEEFLPQQRTVFLVRSLREWVMSDDELDEELDSRLAELFVHVAPIVQNLEGAHWDLLFDLVEANLEVASLEEPESYVLLWHSLRLFGQLMDLAAYNAALNNIWRDRRTIAFEHLRNLFLSLSTGGTASEPRSRCADLLIELVQRMPKSLITDESFAPLVRMLSNPSVRVQKVAYHLLTRLVRRRTEALVVEAAVATDQQVDIKLPPELFNVLTASIEVAPELLAEDENLRRETFGRLLAWLLAFEHFKGASFQLKSAYTEQFRSTDAVASHLVPLVLGLLGVTDKPKPFDLGPWSVEEFYTEYFDLDNVPALLTLAGHVYYRSLHHASALIRLWWSSSQNRQLTLAVSTFTAKHFSPLLIRGELDRLREPEAVDALKDENLTIKIASGANEVTASYVIDEQPMEMGVKLPALFPLESVEVKNLKRVGVSEKQWRAWLLAVQQVVAAQNGPILEALTLFRRNVSLHFEGVTECAICYSIVCAADRSLPAKQCKVCKNKFHAACLYKWFQTSSSSSCPLCRSVW